LLGRRPTHLVSVADVSFVPGSHYCGSAGPLPEVSPELEPGRRLENLDHFDHL